MTDKEKVLAKFPNARCLHWYKKNWTVYGTQVIGAKFLADGKTARQAWANAAKGLE